MTCLVESVLNKRLNEANEQLAEKMVFILERKLLEMKKAVVAKMQTEMDISKEKPEYDSIEDRRTKEVVQNANKGSLPGTQNTNDEGKGNLKTTMINKSVNEEEQLDEARIKIVTRVRNGKVQRRKRVSNVPGMTIRGGKLKRMSPAERRKRKMGARRAKIKRKGKMSRILQKRKRSMRRRQSMGL